MHTTVACSSQVDEIRTSVHRPTDEACEVRQALVPTAPATALDGRGLIPPFEADHAPPYLLYFGRARALGKGLVVLSARHAGS